MNTFLVLAAILGVCLARPEGLLAGEEGHVSVSQSTLGTYKYEVLLKDSRVSEEKFADGTIIGEYTLPDVSGSLRTIKYAAGPDGFKVLDDNVAVPITRSLASVDSIPVQVDDTPEVKAAKEEFFAQYKAALDRAAV